LSTTRSSAALFYHAADASSARQPGQLFAIEKQKIEHEIYKVGRPFLVGRGLHLGKAGGPIRANRTPDLRSAGDVEIGSGHALLDHLVGASEERLLRAPRAAKRPPRHRSTQ
jgi:hypothetical protein